MGESKQKNILFWLENVENNLYNNKGIKSMV